MPSMISPVLDDNMLLDELPDLEEEFEESFELLPPEVDKEGDEQLIILMVCSGLNGSCMLLFTVVILLLPVLESFCWLF